MLKKLLNFLLLSNGITPDDHHERGDKWAEFREQREAWEHERKLERAAPPDADARPDDAAPDQAR